MTEVSPESIAGWVGAATGVAALSITWWKTVRDARSEQPVLWLITPEKSEATTGAKHPSNYAVRISPAVADAHSLRVELYHPGEIGMSDGLQYTSSSPSLKVGESKMVTLTNGTNPGAAWIKLYWSHPRDVRRPIMAWFPVLPRRWEGLETPAADEYLRQGTRPMTWQWIRMYVLQSPVGPGTGILGRPTGWRDRREGRRRLRREGVRQWTPPPRPNW